MTPQNTIKNNIDSFFFLSRLCGPPLEIYLVEEEFMSFLFLSLLLEVSVVLYQSMQKCLLPLEQ